MNTSSNINRHGHKWLPLPGRGRGERATYRLLLLFFLSFFCSQALSAQRTTLRDRNGDIMRGTAIALGRNNALGETRAAVADPDWWFALDSFELNTVRLCWVGPWYDNRDFGPTFTVDQVLPRIDQAVENATAAGLNLIINYHGLNEYGETGGFGRMTEFWRKVAPRYADNDLVYYELNNEQSFDGDDYLVPAFQDTMRRIYEMVRDSAPDRHVILFSFNSLNLPLLSIVEQYDWVDYEHTTVGFHMYGWFQVPTSVGEANLEAIIAAGYPLICTEWDVRQEFNYVTRFYDQDVMAQPLERLGISWTDWRDWGDATNDQFTDVIIPDAVAQGYWWGDMVGTTSARTPLTLALYPNPTTGILYLELPPGGTGATRLLVADALGRTVLRQTLAPGGGVRSLRVDELPPGMYTLRAETDGVLRTGRFYRR